MRNTWAVCRREFMSYFTTPIGYVVVGVFALIVGLGFSVSFLEHARMSQNPSMFGLPGVPDFEESMLSPFLVFCGVLIMFIGPLVTMRLLAEEKSRGTMELLLTHPLRDRDIILGKYGAALLMLLVMMAVVAFHLLIVNYFVDVEPAVLVFGIITVFLMGATFFSLGLAVSAFANNQITAGVMTFALWFVLYVLGTVSSGLPEESPAPAEWSEGLQSTVFFFYTIFRQFTQELALDAHAKDMAQGIVQPRDIVYYLVFTAFFLFVAFRILDVRRWKA